LPHQVPGKEKPRKLHTSRGEEFGKEKVEKEKRTKENNELRQWKTRLLPWKGQVPFEKKIGKGRV